MPKKRKATPAEKARAKRDPAIFRPPRRIRGATDTAVRGLRIRSAGRTYPIGENVEGDTPWSMGMEETATVTLPVRDPEEALTRIFDDEALLQRGGVRITIDTVIYVVGAVDYDGDGLYTLTLEDEVSWRLRSFDTFRLANRKTTTRFGFIYGFVREASARPYPPMRAFIPEVDDPQPIRQPRKKKKT